MTDDASPENLRKFLESDDPAMRRMGLSMAKGMKVPDSYKLVMALSLWDSEEGNREAAKELVEEIGIENIIDKEKLPARGGRTWPLSSRPRNTDKEILVRELSREDAVVPLIMALGDEDFVYWDSSALRPDGSPPHYGGAYHHHATEALGEIGARAVEPLINALGDEDGNVRCHSAEVLGNIGDARAVDPLIEALADENEDVCSAAVEALGEIGDMRAVEPLTEGSFFGPYGDNLGSVPVREAVAWALGQLGPYTDSNYHGRVSDWLFEYFTNASWNEDGVRVAAAWVLGKIGAAEGLLEVIGENGSDIHGVAWSRGSAPEAVAAALEESSGKPIVEYLIDALEVQPGAAAWMLGDIGDARAVEPLIATLGEEYLPYGTYISAHEAIGEALVKIGDARAVEPLIEALGGGDEESDVRRVAAKALGEFGDARAVEPLIEALGDEDEDVRDAAKEALKKLGHEVE
jgi:HEAT repeat protein